MFPSCALKTEYLPYPVRSPHSPKGKAVMQVRHDHPYWMRAIKTHAENK